MFEGPIGKQMMIDQGYVPQTCTLPDTWGGAVIYTEVSAGRSACDRCNEDRGECKGKPRSDGG